MVYLNLNGRAQEFTAAPDTPLLWVLRTDAGLTGTKYGCGVGICGVCTVHLDGKAVKACQVTLGEAAGRAVTTIEGLGPSAVADAWVTEQVPQCGYCQPAMVMAATAALVAKASPGATDRALSEVLCRCGSYARVRKAMARASGPSSAARQPQPAPRGAGRQHRLNPWVAISDDGTVTLRIDRAEMGQGVVTAHAMLIAEELEVSLASVRTEFAPVDPVYANPMFGEQSTGGSTSVRASFDDMLTHGAAAREMLLAAAAQAWNVPQAECRAEDGAVRHLNSNKVLGYGALAEAAAKVRAPQNPPRKAPGQFRLVGKPTPRLEIPAHVRGETTYGLDVRLPGLAYAVVLRPPQPGGTLVRFDAARASQVPGVVQVFAIDAGVAVVADTPWAALTARTLVQAEWSPPGGPGAIQRLLGRAATMAGDSSAMNQALDGAIARAGRVARSTGKAEEVLQRSTNVVDAIYATPFQVHAPMEPMNCTARVDANSADIWAPTQSPADAQHVAAQAASLPAKAVNVTTTFMGGSFGRRMDSDFVIEAVQVAKQVRRPVQVFWSRDDDMRYGAFRPANRVRLRGAVGEDGHIAAWSMRMAGPSMALDGVSLLYDLLNFSEEHVRVNFPVKVAAWRAVGASNNGFIVEGFVDELAHAAKADPLVFRLQHLSKEARLRGVLELAGSRAGWGTPLPAGRGRGVACYRSFGSYVAMVAEVTVRETGMIKVDRVVVAADCGTVVNPDAVVAQMEGSVIFGLGATLLSEVTFKNGLAEQANFLDYPILRYAEAPAIEVYLVESREAPGGAGEPGVPPVAPAVANAVFAATGKRARSLPIRLPK